MDFDAGQAILAGVIATAVMTVLMYMGAAMMKMRMDMPMMLGTMALPPGGAARAMGLVAHFIAGIVFFVIYALIIAGAGIESAIAGWAAVFGLVHGLLAGMMMGMMGAMHPRMAATAGSPGASMMEAPGAFGRNMGSMAPMAIIVLHIVFGVIGGAVYAA